MRVLVLGADGYLGWPTAVHLAEQGHAVVGVDSYVKREWEESVGVRPLVAVPTAAERARTWAARGGATVDVVEGDLTDPDLVHDLVATHRPDAVVHYGQQCSAPFSMVDQAKGVATQVGNVVSNLNVLYALRDHAPQAHLVKLGTMGEYGTPDVAIEEGWLDVTHKGRTARLPYPKTPGSVYHLSKVHDSHNIHFACRIWGLRATDLNQGVVYGTRTAELGGLGEVGTSFHYDEVFGTVLNRFCVQALLGRPLTVHGAGGQTRGFLNIVDTLACVRLACENPAGAGEFRVFNQFTEQFSVRQLAALVVQAGGRRGLDVAVEQVENPRVEAEDHFYEATHTALVDLGLQPHLLDGAVLDGMLDDIAAHLDLADPEILTRGVRWVPARATAPA